MIESSLASNAPVPPAGESENTPWFSKFFFSGVVLGMICFLTIWDFRYLNPANTDWMLFPSGTDFAFGATGSMAFLQEPWSFPPGIIKTLVYPHQTSVVYIDGVPLVAIVAKLFAPLFSGQYQYFGLWGILCFGLQGAFSAVIMRKYTNNVILALLCALFFLYSPFICGKTFGHSSMAGQWVLLAAIALVWHRDKKFVRQHEIALSATLAAVSTGVLAYFTPMVFSLLVVYAWLRWMESDDRCRTSLKMALLFVASLAAALALFWFVGGFVPGLEPSSMDYGCARFNLNGFANPGFASRIIKSLSPGDCRFPAEAYAWLGLGIWVILIALGYRAVLRPRLRRKAIVAAAPFLVVSLCLVAFATTNKVMFGDYLLFEVKLPTKVLKLFSAFRTSGRFVWPVYYLIQIYALGRVAGARARTIARATALAAIFLIQVGDGFNWYHAWNKVNSAAPRPHLLTSEFWGEMGSAFSELHFVPFSGKLEHPVWGEMCIAAVRGHMKLNTFWLGRYPLEPILKSIDETIGQLRANSLPKGKLIALNNLLIAVDIPTDSSLGLYRADNSFLIANRTDCEGLPGLAETKVWKGTLAEYLARLRAEKPYRLLILTARDRTAARLNSATESQLRALGLESKIEGATDYHFVGLVIPKAKSPLFESLSPSKIAPAIGPTAAPPLRFEKTNIELSVDGDYSYFPTIRVNGLDCSQAYCGLNICVYNLQSCRVEEVAVFDLLAMGRGIAAFY